MKPIAIINNIEYLDEIIGKATKLKELALKALPLSRKLEIKKSGFFLIHSDAEMAKVEYVPLIETLKEIEETIKSFHIPSVKLFAINENGEIYRLNCVEETK